MEMDRAPGFDRTLPAFSPQQAQARLTAAQGTVPLPLLPSGPDGIHGRPFARGLTLIAAYEGTVRKGAGLG